MGCLVELKHGAEHGHDGDVDAEEGVGQELRVRPGCQHRRASLEAHAALQQAHAAARPQCDDAPALSLVSLVRGVAELRDLVAPASVEGVVCLVK